jgi:hypothetical protein
MDRPHSLVITLPPLGGVLLKLEPDKQDDAGPSEEESPAVESPEVEVTVEAE